jgi:hypothetical protein
VHKPIGGPGIPPKLPPKPNWLKGASSADQALKERAALKVLEEERRRALFKTFIGTKLGRKRGVIIDDGHELRDGALSVSMAVAEAMGEKIPIKPVIESVNFALRLAGIQEEEGPDFEAVFGEELALAGVKSLVSVAALFTPYLGMGIAGKEMLKHWALTAERGYVRYNAGKHADTDILPGDPEAAARAVLQMISREITNNARLAGIHTAKFTVDVSAAAGAMGADVAGPITGAATAGAKLANTLFLMGRDYREMKAANALLTGGRMPSAGKLFGAYPLLGAYLVAGSDDSTLLGFLASEMGSAGWMDKVERQKARTLAPLQKESRRLIRDSRFTLHGFHGAKVDVEVASRSSRMVSVLKFVDKAFS